MVMLGDQCWASELGNDFVQCSIDADEICGVVRNKQLKKLNGKKFLNCSVIHTVVLLKP